MTELDVKKFIQLVEDGKSYRAAAKAVGFSPFLCKSSAKRFGLEVPQKLDVVQRVAKFSDEIKAGSISQHQIAKQLGVSQCAVNKAYKTLDLPSLPVGKAAHHDTEAKILEVLDHIEQNGGYVQPTIRKLGLKLDKGSVYRYAKGHGIDLSHYQFAYLEFGLWQVQPGPWEQVFTSDYKVSALCRGCGDIHTVQMVNLRAGVSSSCRQCSSQTREYHKVVCKETGERFKSIRAWVKSLGMMKRYIQMRLAIKQNGSYEHKGLTYKLST